MGENEKDDKQDESLGKEGREHVRADDNVPVYYEHWDGKSGISDEGWETMFDDIEPKPEDNPRLYEVLFDINQKLNLLINHITVKHGFNMPEARDVNISGGGLRFYCKETFKPTDKLVLKTFLPTHAHVLKIKCEVVRVNPLPKGGYEVAVRYMDMDDGTREKIIRYLFAKQRRMLRVEKTEE